MCNQALRWTLEGSIERAGPPTGPVPSARSIHAEISQTVEVQLHDASLPRLARPKRARCQKKAVVVRTNIGHSLCLWLWSLESSSACIILVYFSTEVLGLPSTRFERSEESVLVPRLRRQSGVSGGLCPGQRVDYRLPRRSGAVRPSHRRGLMHACMHMQSSKRPSFICRRGRLSKRGLTSVALPSHTIWTTAQYVMRSIPKDYKTPQT